MGKLFKIFFILLLAYFIFNPLKVMAQLLGDANSDGKVDGLDYVIWRNHYNQQVTGAVMGDFNNNGLVDGLDYVIWRNNYGSSGPTSTPAVIKTPTPAPSGTSFNFISWSDTEIRSDCGSVFAQLSNQANALGPEFSIYNGDAECGTLSEWFTNLNGNPGNGLANKTFAVRGNGNGSTSNWSTFFNFSSVANNIGASNYTALTNNMTYSFDYGNSRFIGFDVLGCAKSISSSQISWAEGRIQDAESKGLTHVFMFMHGPIYYVDLHTDCTPPAPTSNSASQNITDLIKRHAIVTATFHGHEHTKSYVHIGPSDTRIPVNRNFDQIVSGGAGGGTYACTTSSGHFITPPDYCDKYEGFANVSVSGTSVTVSFYQQGNTTAKKTVTFSK